MDKLCSYCGKPIKKYKGRVRNQKRFFCSRECHHKFMKENPETCYSSGNNEHLLKLERLHQLREKIK